MDSGLSGEADQHLGDRSNHHQVRTEVILGSYWNMDWYSEVSIQGRLTSSSSMNSCRMYRADISDNEMVVAPSQSAVWPIISAEDRHWPPIPRRKHKEVMANLSPGHWPRALTGRLQISASSSTNGHMANATSDIALSVCSFTAAFLTQPASADFTQTWLQLLLTITWHEGEREDALRCANYTLSRVTRGCRLPCSMHCINCIAGDISLPGH